MAKILMPDSKIKIWLLAARPKTLPAAVAPVMIGASLAWADDGFCNVFILTLTFISAILIQIGTNYANDYYDFVKGTDTAERTGPTRATQAGFVTPAQMKWAFLITFFLAAVAGLVLVIHGGWPILAIGVAALICGVAYTAGPVPLGYVGLADLFVLVFFGPIAVWGTYYLQTGVSHNFVIISGFAPGLISTAILTINNIRDIDTDRAAGKKTLPVRFGKTFGIIEYISCMVGAGLISLFLFVVTGFLFCLLPVFAMLFAIIPCKKLLSDPSADEMNSLLAATGRVLMIYAILFSIGVLL